MYDNVKESKELRLSSEEKRALFDKYYGGYTPVIGRIVVETLPEDTDRWVKSMYGLKEDSLLSLPDEVRLEHVPCKKGRIIKKSQDCFGTYFERIFGKEAADECRTLKEGDIVYYIFNQTMALDPTGTYHTVNADHIIGYDKAKGKE